jgi:hypothetical protein
MNNIEVMKQALEALNSFPHRHLTPFISDARTSLRTALEQASAAQPAPVQYQRREIGEGDFVNCTKEQYEYAEGSPQMDTRVILTPPAAPVPLTDEEAHNVGERAEELLGHGHGAWDTRPLHEIVHAVLTAAEEMNGITDAPEKGGAA